MLNKKLLSTLSVVIIILIAIFAYLHFSDARYNIVITQEQIQQALNKQMPFSKKTADIITVTISNSKVTLKNNDPSVYVAFDFDAGIKEPFLDKLAMLGQVTMRSGLRYDAQSAALYLTNPAVETLDIKGVSAKYNSLLKNGVDRIVAQYFKTHPIYRLKADNFQMKLAKAILKDIKIMHNKVYVQLGV